MEQRLGPAPGESRRKNYTATFWTLAAAGLVLFAMVTTPPGARRSRALRADSERAASIRAGLEYKYDAFQQSERALKTDPFFNEAIMRAKMKYRKPGETEVKTGVSHASFMSMGVPAIPAFIPSRPKAPSHRQRIVSWALLVTSALLLAVAFLFFDRPALDRYGRLIPPTPV